MINLKVLKKTGIGLLLCACSWVGAVHATSADGSQIGVDGTDKVAAVWYATALNSRTVIRGAYGAPIDLPGSIITLTDSGSFDVYTPPKLAMASSDVASTKGVAVWLAKDLTTNNFVIQASVLTNSWSAADIISTNPGPGPGAEHIRNTFINVSISPDGTTIGITWTANISGSNYIRYVYSSDGGTTWSAPVSLS